MADLARSDASERVVAVMSDRALVAEALTAALASVGVAALVRPWPASEGNLGSGAPPDGCDLGLLLCDLDSAWSLSATRAVLARRSPAWSVLTSAPRGALWGAMYEAGAVSVRPSGITLAEMVQDIDRRRRGVARKDAGVVALATMWQEAGPRTAVVTGRLSLLSARESALLRLLHAGLTEPAVAQLWGVPHEEVVLCRLRMLHVLRVELIGAAIRARSFVVDP